MPITRGSAQAGEAFSKPGIVHFGVVLLLSAIATGIGIFKIQEPALSLTTNSKDHGGLYRQTIGWLQ
jgi:hypothetical protein